MTLRTAGLDRGLEIERREESHPSRPSSFRHLLHPIIVGLMNDARDLDATGLEVDDKKHKIANQSTGGEHFHGEEICCSYSPQWAFRKVLQGVRLSLAGAGSIPCSARMRFTVFLPTSWPMLARAPQILVYPQLEFSFAIVSTSSRIVSATRGRPGPRRWLPLRIPGHRERRFQPKVNIHSKAS